MTMRLAAATVSAFLAVVGTATAATIDQRFTASDGVTLQTTLTGADPLAARPTIVEFSPYGRNSGTFNAGPAFNHLLVQIRGTGDSDGRFDALGSRTQADVAETLGWACHQPWSNGTLGLNGFSASAITIYNSLHNALPCVKAAVLKSGTLELYRDLLVPGGINNIVPGTGVLALIGAPALIQGADRLQRNPASALDVFLGLNSAGLSDLLHPNLDSWWQERGFRGDVNHLPILMVDGFYDVESRGAFEAYRALKGDGAHLVVIGAHDGAPAGTDAGAGEIQGWFDHYLRGAANGVESHPRAQLWMSDGDREDMLHGAFVRYDAGDWPVPGTKWEQLVPRADGSLGFGPAGTATTVQAYPALPSLTFNTDPPNTAIVGAAGANALFDALPILSDMTLAQPLGLSYTTAPLQSAVLAAGPLDLDLRLASTAPQTNIWIVISDVGPDGTPHPVASGRLSSDYPDIDVSKSLADGGGNVVEPYGVYDHKTPATIGQSRLYHVELWPIGNRFRAGHRIRLHVIGSSAASLPSLPALNLVSVGGTSGTRLLFPVLPGSDLHAALPAPAPAPTGLSVVVAGLLGLGIH